jgi:hypothetical protein
VLICMLPAPIACGSQSAVVNFGHVRDVPREDRRAHTHVAREQHRLHLSVQSSVPVPHLVRAQTAVPPAPVPCSSTQRSISAASRAAALSCSARRPAHSLGILVCGNASDNDSPEWRTMTVGVLLLVNALLHIIVRKQHPEYDTNMIQQLEEAATRRAAGGGGGGGGGGGAAGTGFGGAVPPPMPAVHPPRSFDSIGPPAPRATTPPRNFGGTPPPSGATAI